MPPHIEEALVKIIRDFVWDKDVHPRIALEYLYKPLSCHETTARAARLERKVLMTLERFGFFRLRYVLGSRHDVALVVATLPLKKGLTGFGHDVA